MKDVQRYCLNAAECLSAAERCGPAYRDRTLAVAEGHGRTSRDLEQRPLRHVGGGRPAVFYPLDVH
jgi:hypothetical protein